MRTFPLPALRLRRPLTRLDACFRRKASAARETSQPKAGVRRDGVDAARTLLSCTNTGSLVDGADTAAFLLAAGASLANGGADMLGLSGPTPRAAGTPGGDCSGYPEGLPLPHGAPRCCCPPAGLADQLHRSSHLRPGAARIRVTTAIPTSVTPPHHYASRCPKTAATDALIQHQ